jgi:hypothetical protein
VTPNNDLLRALTLIGRRERRERVARALAVVKEARKLGLPVKRATIDGVDMEFGPPEAAKEAAAVTELDQWISKHHARSA